MIFGGLAMVASVTLIICLLIPALREETIHTPAADEAVITADVGLHRPVVQDAVGYASVHKTSNNEIRKVVLPDGTSVVLNSNTRLTLSSCFNRSERRVKLDGEAFFDVASDSLKRFVVTCGNNEYEVKGTSFNIISYSADHSSVVTLHSGRLDARVKDNLIVLQPGEELRIDNSVNMIAKHEVDISNSTSWMQDGRLRFSKTPLKFVSSRIAHRYNVKINVHSSVENILYDGQIDKESLDEALRLLSITALVPLSITEFDGEYYISKRKVE